MKDWVEVVAGYIPLYDPDDVERLRRGVDGIINLTAKRRACDGPPIGRAGVAHIASGASGALPAHLAARRL